MNQHPAAPGGSSWIRPWEETPNSRSGRAGRGLKTQSRTDGFGTRSSLLANAPTGFSAPVSLPDGNPATNRHIAQRGVK